MSSFVILLAAAVIAAGSDASAPQWIWGSRHREAEQDFCLRGSILLEQGVTQARLTAVADNCHASFYHGDAEIARREPYDRAVQLDIVDRILPGENDIAVYCRSTDGPAAIMLRLDVEYEDGRTQIFVSGEGWRAAKLDSNRLAPPPPNDHAAWRPAVSFGAVEKYPWGEHNDTVSIRPADNYEQWKQAIGAPAGADPQTFQTLPGFEVQLLRSAAADEDSWVSLACDERGRWIIAKEKQGLLRVTLPKNGGEMQIEPINDTLAECRGLLFAYGCLYAMANNDHALYRLRDTNGDDHFDEVKKLAEFEGGVGHGRNQITLGPDGMIYCIFGDSVEEPAFARSLVPKFSHPIPQEEARSGFVARTDRDGRNWEIVVRGLRNPFGIDFNPDGDMFTYDADAEFDMGSPWYRPTRIDHLVPGGDFGWRSVTGQWPPYYPDRPDMPQPTLDIGKGSPTAVEFGTSSNFPPAYRKALFALDWTYGRILAVHLAPRGSSYAAFAETFLRGRPLNVTDVEFGPDGAMYFITGGRGTQSALYRVAYTGADVAESPPGEQQLARERHAASARKIRRRLESLLSREAKESLEFAWPHLSSSDPWIRHAARAVVESQPVSLWRGRALHETAPEIAFAALLALSRSGAPEDHAAIVERLSQFDLSALPRRQKLEAIFLDERCLTEDISEEPARDAVLAQLDSLYPDSSFAVNQRLSLLLSRLEAPQFVARTMKLLQQCEDQSQRMHYLFVLRNAKEGWTPDLSATYFTELARMSQFIGGEGMPTFRRLIETDALNAAPTDERGHYSKLLLGDLLSGSPRIPQELRPFVRKWMLDDFPEPLALSNEDRDLERGKRMFAAARCIACHRAGGEGGVSGPDLTAVARRFGPRDILTSILEPSRVIAENYQSDIFELSDGRVITRRIAPGDYRSPELTVTPDLLAPEKKVTFSKSEIESHQPSPISPMPAGLLDTLSQDEILDLLAYLAALAG